MENQVNDQKILDGLRVRHERFVEEPTGQKSWNISEFIGGSKLDVTPPTWEKLTRYDTALWDAGIAKFSSTSIAHLKTVAEEVLG